MTLRGALCSALLSVALTGTLSGCGGTLDSLGSDPSANGGSAGVPSTLLPVTHAGSYYNAFNDLLGFGDKEISEKIDAAYQQLFFSMEADQLIYNPSYQRDSSQAVIMDVLHHFDVRSEGIGLAMVIITMLKDDRHRQEFDKLWNYAKGVELQGSGSGVGYFVSHCDEDLVTPCLDTYGMQHFALALTLAHRRWGAASYETDALALLDVLQNGPGGSAFDPASQLVREQPTLAPVGYTRSALEMPAAYYLWFKATGNNFWRDAASNARKHLVLSADTIHNTGLWPMRSNFDGSPLAGSLPGQSLPGFTAQAYRTQLNLALDAAWDTAGLSQPAQVVADRLLGFFDRASNNHVLTTYGANFALDGSLTLDDGITPSDAAIPSQALISVNGALVVAASTKTSMQQLRHDFVSAVWNQPIPSGTNRYYEGLLYMMSMLILGGQMQFDQW